LALRNDRSARPFLPPPPIRRFVIHAPLMWIDRAQTWWLAAELGGDALVEPIREQPTPVIAATA
jgi:hypothetical protein